LTPPDKQFYNLSDVALTKISLDCSVKCHKLGWSKQKKTMNANLEAEENELMVAEQCFDGDTQLN
jgi:hypothetical protein